VARKKGESGIFIGMLSVFVVLTGLGLSVISVQKTQNLQARAASFKPIPTSCQCTGPGKCKSIADSYRCTTSPGCVWTCPATMITPNGGEVWDRGKIYTVTWKQTIPSAWTHLTAYTLDASGSYTSQGAIDIYVDNTIGTHSYSWDIGKAGTPSMNMPDGNNYFAAVELYAADGKMIYSDKSNSAFTIRSPASPATMITPNGGEVWIRGTTYTVTWNLSLSWYWPAWAHIIAYTRDASGNYIPQGAIASYVSTSLGTHSYSWNVGQPGTPSMNFPDGNNYYASINLYDSSGNVIYRDMSNSAFTLRTPLTGTN